MTTDLRALCFELTEYLALLDEQAIIPKPQFPAPRIIREDFLP